MISNGFSPTQHRKHRIILMGLDAALIFRVAGHPQLAGIDHEVHSRAETMLPSLDGGPSKAVTNSSDRDCGNFDDARQRNLPLPQSRQRKELIESIYKALVNGAR